MNGMATKLSYWENISAHIQVVWDSKYTLIVYSVANPIAIKVGGS